MADSSIFMIAFNFTLKDEREPREMSIISSALQQISRGAIKPRAESALQLPWLTQEEKEQSECKVVDCALPARRRIAHSWAV